MSQCAWVPARRLYISAADELITIIPSVRIIWRKISLLFLYLHLLESQKETKFLNSKKSLSSPITLIFFSFAFPLLLVFRQNFPTVLFGEERHFKSLSAGRMTFSVIPWSPPSYSCCASGLCPWTTASLLLLSELSVGSSGEKVLGLLISQQVPDLLQPHKWGEG